MPSSCPQQALSYEKDKLNVGTEYFDLYNHENTCYNPWANSKNTPSVNSSRECLNSWQTVNNQWVSTCTTNVLDHAIANYDTKNSSDNTKLCAFLPTTIPEGRVVGVYFDKQRRIWRANWREHGQGKRKTKNFSVDDYGFEEARRMAVQYRLSKLMEASCKANASSRAQDKTESIESIDKVMSSYSAELLIHSDKSQIKGRKRKRRISPISYLKNTISPYPTVCGTTATNTYSSVPQYIQDYSQATQAPYYNNSYNSYPYNYWMYNAQYAGYNDRIDDSYGQATMNVKPDVVSEMSPELQQQPTQEHLQTFQTITDQQCLSQAPPLYSNDYSSCETVSSKSCNDNNKNNIPLNRYQSPYYNPMYQIFYHPSQLSYPNIKPYSHTHGTVDYISTAYGMTNKDTEPTCDDYIAINDKLSADLKNGVMLSDQSADTNKLGAKEYVFSSNHMSKLHLTTNENIPSKSVPADSSDTVSTAAGSVNMNLYV